MKHRIRHWLGLPLFTARERRNLNGVFWAQVGAFTGHRNLDLPTRIAHSEIIEEYLDALEWLEKMKA